MPRARVVDRRRQNRRTLFFPVLTLATSGVGAGANNGVGAGEDEQPPAEWSSLQETNAFWEVAPLLMSARYLGIPSVPPADVWGPVCVCVRGCVEPKLQGLTSQCGGTGLMPYRNYRSDWYRADVVPNLPRSSVPVSMLYRYRLRCRRPYRYRYQ